MDNQDWLQQQLKSLDGPIADDGFTEQVMAKIENQRDHAKAAKNNKQFNLELWVIVFALLAGLAIALLNFPVAALGIWLAEQNTVLVHLAKMLASSVSLLLITGWIITAASCGWGLMQLR